MGRYLMWALVFMMTTPGFSQTTTDKQVAGKLVRDYLNELKKNGKPQDESLKTPDYIHPDYAYPGTYDPH